MKTIAVVFGTRPEAIKMAPVVRALREKPGVRALVWTTGQHREMLDQVLGQFDIAPDIDLDIMRRGQRLPDVAARILQLLPEHLQNERVDHVVVQGDTTTAMAAAMASFLEQIPVAHVEAGLRSGDMTSPFPEEMNRVVIDRMAHDLFPPTPGANQFLLNEGVDPARCLVTGNTTVDALFTIRGRLDSLTIPTRNQFEGHERIVLVTAHRRESFGQPLVNVFAALETLAARFPDVTFIYPVHPNPNVLVPASQHLHAPNIHKIAPVDYPDMVWLMQRAELILSDSGGVQEEAPALGAPLLVLREVTERQEVIEAGAAELVGTDSERIVSRATALLEGAPELNVMQSPRELFGDGHASERIASRLVGEEASPWCPPEAPSNASTQAS